MRCASSKCKSRKWKFGDGQEQVVVESKGPEVRRPVVMKARSVGATDLGVKVGDTCAVPEVPIQGRYEQWISKKKAVEDEERDPTIPCEEEREKPAELPVWVETPPKPGRAKSWMCREHRTSTCGICEPMNEWLERMKREQR